jgi:hypothetical protein
MIMIEQDRARPISNQNLTSSNDEEYDMESQSQGERVLEWLMSML